MRSTTSISQNQIEETWYLVDAKNKRIGSIATIVSQLLLGKRNPKVRSYHNPNCGVIVINAGFIDFTPKRGETKFYKFFSGFPGGLRFVSLNDQFKDDPIKPLEFAVKGMLPHNKLGREVISKLRIFVDENHNQSAQKPILIEKFK